MSVQNWLMIADNDSLVGHLDISDDIDILISLGDLYDQTLMKAVDVYAPEHAIAVRGNHCVSSDFQQPFIDLHLKVVEINGMRFGGFGGSWQYKSRGNYMFTQAEVLTLLDDFPSVDVFIAHNSPRTIHERDSHIHQGFDAFLDYIDRARPSYFLHGHQHCNTTSRIGDTRVIGIYGEKHLCVERR